MNLRPRRAGVIAAGLLTAVALIALGQPASASTGTATGHATSHVTGRATGVGPASVDTARSTVAKDAGQATHRVPNPLLKEILGQEDEGEGETTIRPSPRSARTSSQPEPVPEPGAERRPDRRRHDRDGRQPGRLRRPQNETTIAINPANSRNIVAGANDYRVFVEREQRNDSSGWAYTSFDGGKTGRTRCCPG